ncbi:MAG: putative lipoprotein [Herbaspirillum sp.]|nr:putative lipoprotein [Herbaspirillum sp.]
MKLFGKIALLLALSILLALFCWGLGLLMAWPLWISAALFIALAGLIFCIRFLRRIVLVLRSRSKLARQSAASRMLIERQATPAAMLGSKWKAAVALLRSSNLKRQGNPLHVLPWYLVIGKSGAGKTTALTRARLASPLQKVDQNRRIEQTANVDWWYFDRAVVIDCAGRYVDAGDSAADRHEWELGLDFLARYRPKHGIDGLVLAISADRLSHPDKDALIAEGSVVRERIEQLIRMFGKRFPIYVLVTKCDQLYGMAEWAQQLPAQALEQAMGYLSEEKSGERGELLLLDEAFESIDERLQGLRMALVARGVAATPALLLFPNELARLKTGLQLFLQACASANPYRETPFLRGLFFCSGLQQGGAASALIGTVSVPTVTAQASHERAGEGLFLHDFFGRILPQDKSISRPAALINHWRTVTQNMGLAAWVLISLALGIVVTLAFAANMATLARIDETRPFDAVYVGRLEADALTLGRVNAMLQTVALRNDDWMARWVAMSTDTDTLEAKLKQSYVGNYRKYILPIYVGNSEDDFAAAIAPGASNASVAALMRNLVRRINLLKARCNGADRAALRAMPQGVHSQHSQYLQRYQRYTPQQFDRLNTLMLSYLAWTPPKEIHIAERLEHLQTQFERAAYADPQMKWLVELMPEEASISAVRASDFWHGSGDADGAVQAMPAAFTRAGKAAIDRFLSEMGSSAEDGSRFLLRRAAFEDWYRQQRILVWQKFMIDFPRAERALNGEEEWRMALGQIGGAQNPYYRLLERVNAEFDDAAEPDGLPDWLQLARSFAQLKMQAGRTGTTQKAARIVDAINTVGGTAMRKTLQGGPQAGRQIIADDLRADALLAHYLAAVDKVAAETVSGQGKSYAIAADFHTFGNQDAKPSPVHAAFDDLRQLKQLLGHAQAGDDAVWRLIEGPLHLVLAYTEQQASCELQKQWQAQVQWPLQAAPTTAAMQDQLYGEKGSFWAFVDGVAKPFLERDAQRFRIVRTLGYSVPFTNAFLPMLNNAAGKRAAQAASQQSHAVEQASAAVENRQAQAQIERDLAAIKQKTDEGKLQSAQLTIAALPTSVNPGALSKPFATVLRVQCAAAPYQLRNFNFPVSASLAWAAGQCSDVALQIKLDALVLTRHYRGAQGMVDFIGDFQSGAREFGIDDFPEARAALAALKVTRIGVHYRFEGQDAVLRIAQQLVDLGRREQQALLEQQELQDAQIRQSEPLLNVDNAAQDGAHVLSAEAWLPQQIGVCWK